MFRLIATCALVVVLSASISAQEKAKAKPKAPPAPRPEPTVADYVYAKDHERQKFDFWQAKSDKPTPVVLLIHGGGWRGGDKSSYRGNMIDPFQEQGISVAAINYRFIEQAMEQ